MTVIRVVMAMIISMMVGISDVSKLIMMSLVSWDSDVHRYRMIWILPNKLMVLRTTMLVHKFVRAHIMLLIVVKVLIVSLIVNRMVLLGVDVLIIVLIRLSMIGLWIVLMSIDWMSVLVILWLVIILFLDIGGWESVSLTVDIGLW